MIELGYERPALDQILRNATNMLARSGIENPRFEAELMLAEAAGATRVQLLARIPRVDAMIGSRFMRMVARRAAREPFAYIVGRKAFHSLELEVGPAVLIPRCETESLVDIALAFLIRRDHPVVLDLGTGSGAIALAIADNDARARLVATDISVAALALARRNSVRLGLARRVELVEADCWSARSGLPLGNFDLIVSNPPYVCDSAIAALQPEIARYEPRVALRGGTDGLDFYRRIAAGLRDHLLPDGAAMVEVGDDQAEAVAAILSAHGFDVTTHRDLAGIARVVQARKRT
ncbi:MAG: peptide chain release factor N(5)-glutamine methyltransferase [Candidatus Binataceae bacterium]